MKFARFFRTPILYMIIDVMQYRPIDVLKNLAKFTGKFMWTTASGISENRPCLAGCKFFYVLQNSVLKVLSLSTEMQFSTDLALMNTQPQRIKVDDATRTNDSRDISWYPDSCKGKLLKLISLTNLFETLYPRLINGKTSIQILNKTFYS